MEASNFALHVSGFGRQGLGNHGREQRSIWTKDRHRSARRVQRRSRRTVRRCDPDWGSQHAEFYSPQEGGPVEAAGAAEARDGRNARGVVARGRIHHGRGELQDRKSTRLNSSHMSISYAVFCLKKKNQQLLEKTKKQRNKQKKP